MYNLPQYNDDDDDDNDDDDDGDGDDDDDDDDGDNNGDDDDGKKSPQYNHIPIWLCHIGHHSRTTCICDSS